MTTPAIAPYVTTYASRTPYITSAEWINAPTALDISDLLPDQDTQAQQQALADAISRASSWIDRLCGPKVLAATSDILYGRYRIDRYGVIKIPLPFTPVLEVSAVSIGPRPSQMQALTDLTDVVVGQYGVIEVPACTYPHMGPGFGGTSIGDRPLVQVTYVNGWPNTLTSASAAEGVSTLPVESGLGIYPGTQLTIYDGEDTEQVTVAAGYTPGALTVPLLVPLAYAHADGISVSSLPPVVKEAAILLTSAMIQTRGNDAIVLDSTETPQKEQNAYGASAATIALAQAMLTDFRRVR